jgi:exopolysaccharide biosynthesis polyprenyl glycosylphosphotransferase
MNLLDGLDGLAAGVATIIFATFAIIALQSGRTLVALINIILILANSGFLRYNFHPASIFMGDAGSLFLGFSISVISLEIGRIGNSNSLNLIIPLTVLAVPALDTTISFFRRAGKRMHPFMADKEHIHHRLMTIGFSHKNSVRVIYFFSIVAGFLGFSFLWLNVEGIFTILLVGSILLAMVIRRLGYVEIKKNLIVVGNGENNGNRKINGLLNGNSKKENKFIPFDTSEFIQTLLFIFSDILFIVLAFGITYYWRVVPFLPFYRYFTSGELVLWVSWTVIYWIVLLGANDLYRIEWDTSRIDEIFTVIKIILFGTLFIFFLTFEIHFPIIIARRILVIYGFLLVTGLSFGRLLIIGILKNNDLLGFKRRPTLIIGASNRAINVATKIKNVPVLKFDLVGYIDDHANGNVGKIIQGIPILGGFEDIPTFIKQKKIKEVIIALDDSDSDTIMDLIAIFSHYNVSVKLLPDFYNLVSGFKTSHIYGVSLIRFFSSNMKTWEWLLKRIIDIAVSLMVLIVFIPIWMIIALAILVDSAGPIFYKQKRVGKNKQEFELIKFRSMMHNAEDLTGPKWAEKEDSRITRLGKLLRKTGLDEIPQFFNVLMGNMSIVGPRPERLYFVNELEQTIQFYSRRLIIKPGITGWAQIKYKYDESIDDVREKLRYDLYYIENMSILLDLKIIVQTLLVGIRKKHQAAYN